MTKILSGFIFLSIILASIIFPLYFLRVQAEATIDDNWTLVLGGDVMLGRSVTGISLDTYNDPNYPFLKIKDLLSSSDITYVNLETPIVNNCPRRDSGMVFCSDQRMLNGLVTSGVDIVNLSNNHTLNYGERGLLETKTFLDMANIKYSDNKNLVIINQKNVKIGFLGFDKDQQANPKLSETEKELIINSRMKVDVLVVAMHWGIEYKAHPTEGQRILAQELVNLGADLVVGHHPHWIQDVDNIEHIPVYYSLGNLVFDQDWSEETRKGLVMKVTFEGKKIIKEEKINVYMKNFSQPEIIE